MNPENFDEGDTQVAPPGGFKKIGCGLMVAKTKSGEIKMRYCIVCEKAMHTSLNSVWIDGKSYDVHKKCEEKVESQEKGK